MVSLFARRVPILVLASLCCFAAVAAPSCNDALFVDAIAERDWVNLDLSPAQGTAGLRQALANARDQHSNRPVRIRLAPGNYADNLGSEIYAQRLLRSSSTPIYIVATDSRPNATQLGHGINLLGVAYLAIDGVTIGPATVGAWNGKTHADPQPIRAAAGIHVSGAASRARDNANVGGKLDRNVYGRFEPSHHIVVRRVTIQNLFDPSERDAETSESLNMDGMKFNQVTDLWVLDSTVTQTTRHGIDNVGVHRAAFCRNAVSRIGGGLGIEAKGGSVDILFDSNTFYRVRRVELGGESTDATYYYSADDRWDYEGARILARNNLIIDPREAAIEFSGCQDCTATGNSVLFTASYNVPRDADNVFGGDAIRVHDSVVLSARDGAGSDCQWWDGSDYVTVDPCWGVGANVPAPINTVLRSDRLSVRNNLFASAKGTFSRDLGGSTIPCPLNVIDGNASLNMDGNYWWNGPHPLPTEGCSALPEGSRSIVPGPTPSASPLAASEIDGSTVATSTASAISALKPSPNSPLAGRAISDTQLGSSDHLGAPRNNTIGALGANPDAISEADRTFNWAERYFPSLFQPASASSTIGSYYLRHYATTQHYLGSADGKLYAYGPITNNQLTDLGTMQSWLVQAKQAGF